MMQLIWSLDAENDLDAATDYIARDNVLAAINIREEIESQVRRLQTFPQSGRLGRMRRTRELVVAGTPYIVIYRVEEGITLVRVLHGAQQWPPSKAP